MIELIKVKKTFYTNQVLNELTLHIPNATIFGLYGSNGSGKSTILRLISGVYNADGGYVKIDGQSVYENTLLKQQLTLVSDELYFLPQASLSEMRRFYQIYYPDFSDRIYHQMLEIFPIKEKVKLTKMNKSLQKQASLILAFAINPRYLLLDEAFEGLDLNTREALKKLLQSNVKSFGQTVIITSNNLLELEDTCDSVAMIADGKVVLSTTQNEIETNIHKIQLAFKKEVELEEFENLEIAHFERHGHVVVMIVKGDLSKINEELKKYKPFIIDKLPMNLEEIFMYETRGKNHG